MPQTNEGVLLLIGAVFVLIGVLGGGIEISAVKIPPVGKRPRAILSGIGIFFIAIALAKLLFPPSLAQPLSTALDTPTLTPISNAVVPVEKSILPTGTPVPPTKTATSSTHTPVPPTNTINPPTDTPASEAGAASTQTPMGWEKIQDLPRQINALVVNPSNPQVIYAATGDYSGSGSGVYMSADAGLTWQLAAKGLPSESVTALALNPDNPATLYAMAGVRGDVFVTTDGAANWSLLGDTGLFGGYDRLLRVDPLNSHILFALAKSDILVRSQDGGQTWLPIGDGLPGDDHSTFALSLAIDPSDSNILYVGTGGFVGKGQGVYKSTDGGDTWAAVNRGMLDYRIISVAVHPVQTGTVYAGSDNGEFFRSIDGGQSWEELTMALPVKISDHPTIRNIMIQPDTPDTIILLVDDAGIVVSTDGGNNWRLLGQPGQISFTIFTAMAISQSTEPVMFVGIEREGGWRYAPF